MKTSSAVGDYSTKRPTKQLMTEIRRTLARIQGYGSVEIIIQDHKVVQITERNIKKVNNITITNGNSISGKV